MNLTTLPFPWAPLADAALKASVILVLAAAAAVTLRRASAASRHLVWTLALCSALAVPAVGAVLPTWDVPLLVIPQTTTAAIDRSSSPVGAFSPVPPERHLPPHSVQPAPATAAAPAAPRDGRDRAWSPSWAQLLGAVWLAGAALIVARIGAGLAAVRWLSRRSHETPDAPWLPTARSLAGAMGVSRRLRFLRSPRATMPAAAGLFRQAIIMPADADTWSDARLRIVLLHELAHVKRRDCLTHLLGQLACAFYWFNPLVWMAAARARRERERACDDLVLASGTRGADYADQLLDIARLMRGDRFRLLAPATLGMAHHSQLEGRLLAILDPQLPRAGVSRVRALAAAAVCASVVAPLGAVQPWAFDSRSAYEGTPAAVGAANPAATATPSPVPAASVLPSPPVVHEAIVPLTPVVAEATESVIESTGAAVAAAAWEAIQDAKDAPAGDRKVDSRTVAALTAALKDSDQEVREAAMHALVQLRDPSVFEPLLQALMDASPDVREQAAFGLGQLRDARAVQPLAAALKDANESVREQAVFALGQIRDAKSVAPLLSALKDAIPDVRAQAAFALGQLRDRAAVESLIVAMKDADADVREQVVFALGQIRDPRALESLAAALKDVSADVREQAAFALGQLAR